MRSIKLLLVSGSRSNPKSDLALARDCLPLRQCGGASFFVDVTADEMAFVVEMVVDRGMEGAEFLEDVHPSKPQHGPLSALERLVGILGPVVQPATGVLDTGVADLLHRGAVRALFVGHDGQGLTMALHHSLEKL